MTHFSHGKTVLQVGSDQVTHKASIRAARSLGSGGWGEGSWACLGLPNLPTDKKHPESLVKITSPTSAQNLVLLSLSWGYCPGCDLPYLQVTLPSKQTYPEPFPSLSTALCRELLHWNPMVPQDTHLTIEEAVKDSYHQPLPEGTGLVHMLGCWT